MFTKYIQILFYTLLYNILDSHTIPIELTDTDNYLPPDDPNITNLMVSHYNCEKQHNLRQFNLLNVKPCNEAPSIIQHANVRARVYVRAKAKRVEAFKCEAYAKKERKICFQGSVRYRRVDRTVWNHNTFFWNKRHFFSVHSCTNNGIKGTSHHYVRAPHAQNPHNPSLSRFKLFPHTQTFCGISEALYTTQYSDLFVTYQEGFNMHAGQPNPQSIINDHITGKIVLDSTTKHYVFPAFIVSNNFATTDYDAHINTKIDYTINHVFRSMTVQELNTLHTICELERNQLLTILAMSVQNPQLAGFLLTRNRSNFLYVEGSTAWLYDCPHYLSPLYKADRCFDGILIQYKDTPMYVDPSTRQTYDYATPIPYDNDPRNIIELDPDTDDQDFYILCPEPIKRKHPLMFTPNQIKTKLRPNTFTAEDAGM